MQYAKITFFTNARSELHGILDGNLALFRVRENIVLLAFNSLLQVHNTIIIKIF